jgi:hypothetical protein
LRLVEKEITQKIYIKKRFGKPKQVMGAIITEED